MNVTAVSQRTRVRPSSIGDSAIRLWQEIEFLHHRADHIAGLDESPLPGICSRGVAGRHEKASVPER
jgi:hypothetical protein